MSANDNKTMLYRIRRKSDGRFLDSKPSATPGPCYYFGPRGIFWQSEDKVREHLKELTAFRIYIYEEEAKKYRQRPVSDIKSKKIRDSYGEGLYSEAGNCYTKQHLVRYVDEWMDLYEVIATPATIHYTESQILDARIFEEKQDLEAA